MFLQNSSEFSNSVEGWATSLIISNRFENQTARKYLNLACLWGGFWSGTLAKLVIFLFTNQNTLLKHIK